MSMQFEHKGMFGKAVVSMSVHGDNAAVQRVRAAAEIQYYESTQCDASNTK